MKKKYYLGLSFLCPQPNIHTSVHREQFGSHPTDFYKFLGLESLLKSVNKIQVWLKLQLERKIT